MFFPNDFMLCVTKDIMCYGGTMDGKSIKKAVKDDFYSLSLNEEYKTYVLQSKVSDDSVYKLIHIIAVPNDFEFSNQENIVNDFNYRVDFAKKLMIELLGK